MSLRRRGKARGAGPRDVPLEFQCIECEAMLTGDAARFYVALAWELYANEDPEEEAADGITTHVDLKRIVEAYAIGPVRPPPREDYAAWRVLLGGHVLVPWDPCEFVTLELEYLVSESEERW